MSSDICPRTAFWERSSGKTVSFEEQMMLKDKYFCIFSRQMETIVFIIFQIFSATPAVFKIGDYLRRNPPEVRVTSGQKPSTKIIYIVLQASVGPF